MNVREKIEYLPHDPGVYRYLDASGKIIYVGKAKDLKRRVSQYFRPPEQLDRKTRALVEHIADLTYTVVETEEDALLLENNLIKQLQPHYNILLKDDKTYPWICIRNEPFPRVMLTRRYVQDGSLYFGPYASVHHARRLLDLMGSLWKLRICAHALTPEQIEGGKLRCCLNYHLEKCAGPCEGLFSAEEYQAQIEEIRKLLSGRTRELMYACRAKMQEAAADLRFEEAQEWKERLALLEAHHEREKSVGHGILDMETYKLLKEKTLPRRIEKAEKVVAQLQKDLGMSVPPRHIECFDNSNIQGTNPVASCVVFRDGLPCKRDYRHFNIKTVVGANDYASMKEVVNRRYSRLMAEGEELPQLVVIDGGKGQLGFALEALMELGISDKIFRYLRQDLYRGPGQTDGRSHRAGRPAPPVPRPQLLFAPRADADSRRSAPLRHHAPPQSAKQSPDRQRAALASGHRRSYRAKAAPSLQKPEENQGSQSGRAYGRGWSCEGRANPFH